MKHIYIESLLIEIQQLESKVVNLKKNQNVSFSFFKESFKRTQEITRLLHELEFVQIEDMKEQMGKLVQFLLESESSKEEIIVPPVMTFVEEDNFNDSSDKEEQIATNADVRIHEAKPTEVVEDKVPLSGESQLEPSLTTYQESIQPTLPPVISHQRETIVQHLGANNKSLNDVQPINHTIQDVRSSISLNDRFLFQRELFHNNRVAMNDMLTKLQSFSSYEIIEGYLKTNTHWNFKDETVQKFMEMLKDNFR